MHLFSRFFFCLVKGGKVIWKDLDMQSFRTLQKYLGGLEKVWRRKVQVLWSSSITQNHGTSKPRLFEAVKKLYQLFTSKGVLVLQTASSGSRGGVTLLLGPHLRIFLLLFFKNPINKGARSYWTVDCRLSAFGSGGGGAPFFYFGPYPCGGHELP